MTWHAPEYLPTLEGQYTTTVMEDTGDCPNILSAAQWPIVTFISVYSLHQCSRRTPARHPLQRPPLLLPSTMHPSRDTSLPRQAGSHTSATPRRPALTPHLTPDGQQPSSSPRHPTGLSPALPQRIKHPKILFFQAAGALVHLCAQLPAAAARAPRGTLCVLCKPVTSPAPRCRSIEHKHTENFILFCSCRQ